MKPSENLDIQAHPVVVWVSVATMALLTFIRLAWPVLRVRYAEYLSWRRALITEREQWNSAHQASLETRQITLLQQDVKSLQERCRQNEEDLEAMRTELAEQERVRREAEEAQSRRIIAHVRADRLREAQFVKLHPEIELHPLPDLWSD